MLAPGEVPIPSCSKCHFHIASITSTACIRWNALLSGMNTPNLHNPNHAMNLPEMSTPKLSSYLSYNSQTNPIIQLERLYRGIAALETKILNDEGGPDEGRVLLKERGKDLPDKDAEVQKCKELIRDPKW